MKLRRFVSAIHIPDVAPSTLISGGGDPTLKIWEWMTGSLLYEVTVFSTVHPFIKVRPKKRKWGEDHDVGEEVHQHKKPHGRKGRRRNKVQQGGEDREVEELGEELVVEDDGLESDEETSTMQEPTPEALPDPVLVIHKIETMVVSEHRLTVFSATGLVLRYLVRLSRPSNYVSHVAQLRCFGASFPILKKHWI